MSRIILLNKPFQVMCQFTDSEDRRTLADFVSLKNVYPAGRLDYDSEGLVILTDDGVLQHQISHPKAKMSKTYWVQVEGSPSDSDIDRLQKGLVLADGPCANAVAAIIEEPNIWQRIPPIRERKNLPTSWIELTIKEGRNRQVRRMTAAIGYPTLRLIRIKVGEWSVHHLAPGKSEVINVHRAKKRSGKFNNATRGRSRL